MDPLAFQVIRPLHWAVWGLYGFFFFFLLLSYGRFLYIMDLNPFSVCKYPFLFLGYFLSVNFFFPPWLSVGFLTLLFLYALYPSITGT